MRVATSGRSQENHLTTRGSDAVLYSLRFTNGFQSILNSTDSKLSNGQNISMEPKTTDWSNLQRYGFHLCVKRLACNQFLTHHSDVREQNQTIITVTRINIE